MTLIIQHSQDQPSNRFTLLTKIRRVITLCDQPPEDSAEMLLTRDAPMRRMFPELRPRSQSATYNCLGLVFAARRASIDSSVLMTLLADDGYVRIARQDAVPGDLVVYAPDATSNFQHVGIIYTVPVAGDGILDMMVLSKWGEAGEYLHPLNKVPPMYGKPQSFWTEKRIISS